MRTDHLVTWENLNVRVSGEQLTAMARSVVRDKRIPIRDLNLVFKAGEILISGKVDAILPLPFTVAVRKIIPGRTSIRIPLESASAFGFLPVPKLFFHLAQNRMQVPGVTMDAATATIQIALDRFLPEFLDVEIEAIDPVAGGVAVRLGAGGATPPVNLGG